MGLFDSLMFQPQADSVQGLLSRLSPSALFQPGQSDGLGSPSPQFAYGQDRNIDIGGYQMPQFGTAPQPNPMDANAQLPQNAQATTGQFPTVAPQQAQDAGIGDRILSALSGFGEGGREGGLIGAITGGIAGASGGVTTRNQTAQALIAHGLDPALAQTVVKNPSLLRAVLPQILGTSGQTSDIKEYEFARKQGFTGSLADWMARKRAGAGEFGMTPIWGVGPDGKPAVVQLGKNGEAKLSTLPQGFQVARDPIKVEGPTGTTILDPQTRQQIGFIPKDLRGAEIQKVEGEAQGKARVELPGAVTDAEQTVKKIDELLKAPGLDSIVGPIDQFRGSVTLGDQGRDALARFNQLKGTAFLSAYAQLRGGGAITEIEGKKAEDAMARMDRAQGETDFKRALEDFRDVVKIGVGRIKTRAGVSTTSQPETVAQSAAPKAADPLGIR